MTPLRKNAMDRPNEKRLQMCFSGNILAIDKERLKRDPLVL
jgi:hypothetical protein